jgi:hypothetical protein
VLYLLILYLYLALFGDSNSLAIAGPFAISVSPNSMFRQHNSGLQNKIKSGKSSSNSKGNAKVGSGPATPASTFSSSLGIKLKGSTGRSIDTWLQKHKKNQAPALGISQANGVTPRVEALPSLSQQRQSYKVQPQTLEAAVALKSQQVGAASDRFKLFQAPLSRSALGRNA